MQISKFQKFDVDVLLEWIYDDENFIAEDYRIVIDTLKQIRSFSQNEFTGTLPSVGNNTTEHQLFSLDSTINRWGIVDPNPATNRYLFLQYQTYSGNVPFRYDKVRIHFPVNYTFADKLGFLLNLELMDKNQDRFPISNYFFDKTDTNRVLEMVFGVPFQFDERIWGKYVELQVPSPYALTTDYQIQNNIAVPIPGTIHKNLVDDDLNVLSLETPIFITFQFLTLKEDRLKQISYLTTPPISFTIPVIPEFESLGVAIQHASDGNDYFEIYGTFNNNISDFNTFIINSQKLGQSYYVIFEITQFEKNILVSTVSNFKSDTFDIPIDYRPIIKYSTTTASINVAMKVVNSSDGSIILRTAQYTMLQDEASKYSKKLSKINIKDTYKPKVYNAKPDQLTIEGINISNSPTKIQVPYAIMYERFNIVSSNKSEQINDTTYYAMGLNQILLHHTDNVVEFKIAKGTNTDGFVPFVILDSTPVFLQFKSNKTLISIPLFYESGNVDLSTGNIVFRITSSQMPTISDIKKDGFDQFYIVISSAVTGIDTVVYFGRFIISNEF